MLPRVAACLTLVLSCLASVAGPARAAVPVRAGVPVSATNGFYLFKGPQSQWDRQLAAMRANGIQTVRSDAAWGDVQPQAPTSSGPGYQWSTYDAWVRELAAHGLTWQPTIDFSTSWAVAYRNTGAFAAFAQAVAARYGAHGSFWTQHQDLPYLPARIFEIWNEENAPGTYYVSPRDYGPLYAAAHDAIHAVDPTASVDVGALADDSESYVPAEDYPGWYLVFLFGYYPQLERSADGFALHPYGRTATDVEQWVAHFRWVLTHYNVPPTVPLDLNEFGWPYKASAETWRAAQMRALGDVLSRSSCGVREVAPYDWINPTSVGAADFGFVAPSGVSIALRPAARAWLNALGRGGRKPTYALCS